MEFTITPKWLMNHTLEKIKNKIKQVFENIIELQSEYNLTIMKSNRKSITEKHSNAWNLDNKLLYNKASVKRYQIFLKNGFN